MPYYDFITLIRLRLGPWDQRRVAARNGPRTGFALWPARQKTRCSTEK